MKNTCGPDDDMWDLATDSSDGGECLHDSDDVSQGERAFHIVFEDEQDLDAESDNEGSEFDC